MNDLQLPLDAAPRYQDVPFPRARRSDPGTAHAAAATITPGRLETLILATVRDLALTDDEIAARLSHHHAPSVKTARSRLSNAGLLADTGQRRRSTRGRLMVVWARTR